MHPPHRRRLEAACAITLALAAAPVRAEPAAVQLADAGLQRVSVTAKGYATLDVDTPASTVLLERDELWQRGAANVGEALRGESGLAVAADSPQGQNPVIRGLKREGIVLLVDGMRLNSAQPAGAIASFMSLGLAERVEVVKGPASVLYGTGALGGVVQVQLPQARFDPGRGARATLWAGGPGRGAGGAAVVNVAGDAHAAMLGVSQLHANDVDTPRGRVARSGYDGTALIAQARTRLGAAQQLRASLQQHDDDDVWYPGSTRPHPNPQVGSTTVYSPHQRRRLAEVGWQLGGNGARALEADLRVYRHEVEREVFSRANGPLGRDVAQTRVRFDTDGLALRVDARAHAAHQLAFGVDAWRMSASPQRLVAQPPTLALARNDPFDDGRIDALGAYLQDDMVFGRLRLLAGLRADRVRGRAASIANGAVTQGLARSDTATSGSLGAVFELAPLLRPYASVARAFRAGEMRERFEASPRADGFYYLGNPQIRPETALQFELGAKGEQARLQYQLALWRSRIDDYITGRDVSGAPGSNRCPPINAGACKETVNLGRASLHGVEAQLRWQAAPGHWLSAAASALRGTNDDLDEPLFQMPADQLRLGWDGALAGAWRADATLLAVRAQRRVATVFARGTENPTPGYATLDLGLVWQPAPGQRLRLALRNVADRAYREHLADGVSGHEPLASGRSVQVSWTGSFR